MVVVVGVLLQTERKTMWGQGLQGLKVTNPPRLFFFPDQQSASKVRGWNYPQSNLHIQSVQEKPPQEARKQKQTKQSLIPKGKPRHHTRCEDDIRKDSVGCALSPNPHKEEKQQQQKKRKIPPQFHAWQNFLFVQKAGEGGFVGGQHLRADFGGDPGDPCSPAALHSTEGASTRTEGRPSLSAARSKSWNKLSKSLHVAAESTRARSPMRKRRPKVDLGQLCSFGTCLLRLCYVSWCTGLNIGPLLTILQRAKKQTKQKQKINPPSVQASVSDVARSTLARWFCCSFI